MRWGHTRATAEVPCSAHMAADMLCQRNGSLNAGETQHARSNQNRFEAGIAKDKARHIVTPLAAAKAEAARIARIRYHKSNTFRPPLLREVPALL
jgi:hypothetical protein